jgi:hypothetical protein
MGKVLARPRSRGLLFNVAYYPSLHLLDHVPIPMLESVSMMQRQLELEFFALRYVPDVVYGRFINVGIVMSALMRLISGRCDF